MEKMKMHSPNLTQDNIARIREVFPNCVTEAKGEDGNLKLAVDFDLLRQELTGSIVEGPQERYQLNWPGKREALLTANAPIAKTLRPCREESVNFDTTQNLFIEGDNLDALKLLQETYLGKVKMIYIDPPYNTGNDFIYEDDFAEDTDEFLVRSNQKDEEGNRLTPNTESNGRFHSDWLSMIYSRLKLARNLLRDDGVIFISIDDNEQANLKRVCDEVFGEVNFVAVLPWKGKGGGADNKYLMIAHEYLLMYAKEKSSFTIGEEIKYENSGFNKFDPIKNRNYKTQLARKWGANSKRSDRPNLFYGVDDGNGKMVYPLLPDGSEGCWRWSKNKMLKEIGLGNVEFHLNEQLQMVVYEKIYEPLEGEFDTKKYSSWLDDTGNTAQGSKELKTLMAGKFFDFPKPTLMISRILGISGSSNEDDIILDFFAGSSTTAHAVMQLNAEDGGNRKFIMVQLPETCDEKSEAFKAGYSTIAEISKERIRRAGKKILETEHHQDWNQDIGFRVLKVDTSNMADIYYTPDQLSQDLLTDLANNIKPDRTDEDLLFQVLLDWGVDLTLPITKEIIQDQTVFFVDNTSLVACFDATGGIDEVFVKELAKRQPLRVVFRDTGFKDSAVKINIEQIFKVLSPSTEVKSI